MDRAAVQADEGRPIPARAEQWLQTDPRPGANGERARATPLPQVRRPAAHGQAGRPAEGPDVKLLHPEEALLRQILQLARLWGWASYHQRPARTARGWRTALSGCAGFPDLVLVRG